MSARKPIKLHGCLGSALDCEACQDLYWPAGSRPPYQPPPDPTHVRIGRKVRTVTEWARRNGVAVETARDRIARGWDPVRAVTDRRDGRRKVA